MGCPVGWLDGIEVGCPVGLLEGIKDGLAVGDDVGSDSNRYYLSHIIWSYQIMM